MLIKNKCSNQSNYCRKQSNRVPQTFVVYFLQVTLTDAPNSCEEDGNDNTTFVVDDDTVQLSPCPTRSTVAFRMPFTRVGCEVVMVKSVSVSLNK